MYNVRIIIIGNIARAVVDENPAATGIEERAVNERIYARIRTQYCIVHFSRLHTHLVRNNRNLVNLI